MKICKLCKKEHNRKQSPFCCSRCKNKFNYQKRQKISEKRTRTKEEYVKILSERNKSLIGDKNPNWKGGKIISSKGYPMILKHDHPRSKSSNGYVHEHILVMEKKIKRYVTKEESVHHINGNKKDNRIENLQLMSISEHQSMERKKFWKNISKEKKQQFEKTISKARKKFWKNISKEKKQQFGKTISKARLKWIEENKMEKKCEECGIKHYRQSKFCSVRCRMKSWGRSKSV